MTPKERAERIAHWGWAAVTLGVEALPDRVMGLVEVTASIPLASLRPALELVIKSEPQGFLPSPGAVIAASKRLAEHSSMTRPRIAPGPMSDADRKRWEAENNPQGWDSRTWAAFLWRMSNDVAFARRAKQAAEARQDWAERELNAQIDRRRTAAGFRIDFRKQLNREAFDHFPRPDPFEHGWTMPAHAVDPISALSGRMQVSRDRRGQRRLPLEEVPRGHDDSKGIAAARAAVACRKPEPNPRSWS